jgi:hypothetical protein
MSAMVHHGLCAGVRGAVTPAGSSGGGMMGRSVRGRTVGSVGGVHGSGSLDGARIGVAAAEARHEGGF